MAAMANPEPSKTYNILFLGETQSGKSTLIESLKQYSDPNYIINKDNIGDGIFSLTRQVSTTTIHTDVPSYFVTDKAGKRVDYGQFVEGDHEDYEDELNERKKYLLEREESAGAKVSFNLIDTPGLNDTIVTDEINIANIFKGLEGIRSINLVVIVIANNPFTDFLRDALKTYINLLPDFNSNIVFVHTKIEYGKLHHEETIFVQALTDKKQFLGELVGRDSVSHLVIDNDLGSNKTIRNCITKNSLRSLLAMAKQNQPIPLQIMHMVKTKKMRTVDNILKEKYIHILAMRETVLGRKNTEMEEAQAKRPQIESEIIKHETDLQNTVRDLAFYDRDILVLLHEERYDQTWSMMKLGVPKTAMYYPGKTLERKPDFVDHVIDHIDIQAHNIEVLQKAGGVGCNHWAVKFRRKRLQDGVYHVKIYIKRSKKYSTHIEELRTKEIALKRSIMELKETLRPLKDDGKMIPRVIQEIIDDLTGCRYILGQISTQEMHFDVFQSMVENSVYVRDDSESAARLEDYLWKKRSELEKREEGAGLLVSPWSQDEESSETLGSGVQDPGLFAELQEEEERRDAEALALAEATKATDPSRPPTPDRSEEVVDPQYSILMFGKTQAGKSTFIEYVRNYADADHAIDKKLLGNMFESKTGMTRQFTIASDLPTYEAYNEDSDEPIDTEALCKICTDMDDYHEVISNRDTTLRLAQQHPNPLPAREVTIRFLDTPGINDTNYRDVEYAQKIIKEMIEIQSFNLIVIIVNFDVPIHMEQKVAFNYYSRVFHALQGHHDNVVFVYTHVPYKCRHQPNAGHTKKMETIHKAFSCLFRGGAYSTNEGTADLATAMLDKDLKLYPYYTVDLQKHRPICKCMMQETLRDILRLAVAKPAHRFNTSKENLDRVWAIVHPDKENYEKRQEKKAREEEEELRQWQQAEAETEAEKEAEAEVEKGAHSISSSDVVEGVGSLSIQTDDDQDADMPDWLKRAFDGQPECTEEDDDEDIRHKEE